MEVQKLNKPKAIIFDLGDTLLKSNSFNPIDGVRELLKYANNPNGFTAEEIQFYADKVLKDLGGNEKGKLLQIDNKSLTRLVYGAHGITFNKTADELDLIFLDGAERTSLVDGIIEILEFLKGHGIRLAILSNTGFSVSTHRSQLKRYDIDKYFECFIATSDYCIRKPDKRIFELALSNLGLKSSDAWYVGNKFEYDIVGANNANIFPVWVNEKCKTGHSNIKHLDISSYAELLEILKNVWDI